MRSSFHSSPDNQSTTSEPFPAIQVEWPSLSEIQPDEISALIPADGAIVEAAILRNRNRPCPSCQAANAADHPLAVGGVVTSLQFRSGGFVVEGIGTILYPADEPDTYFIRFRGTDRVKKCLIFHDYQRDVARALHVFNRHLTGASL